MSDEPTADETEQNETAAYSDDVHTAVGDDISGDVVAERTDEKSAQSDAPGEKMTDEDTQPNEPADEMTKKGTMSEAPEHVARKSPEEVTADDLDYLDEQAKRELADVLGVESIQDVYDFYDANRTTEEQSASASDTTPTQTQAQVKSSPSPTPETAPDTAPDTTDDDAADTQGGRTSAQETQPDATDRSEASPTLDETGLTDDEGNFPWEDAEDTELGTVVRDAVQVKGTSFDFVEPEDGQVIEQAGEPIANVRQRAQRDGVDPSDDELNTAQQEYRRNCAHAVAQYDDTPLDRVYLFKTGDGKPNKIVSADRYPNVADHPDSLPFWDALTELDRYRFGAKAQLFIDDIDRFRQFNL